MINNINLQYSPKTYLPKQSTGAVPFKINSLKADTFVSSKNNITPKHNVTFGTNFIKLKDDILKAMTGDISGAQKAYEEVERFFVGKPISVADYRTLSPAAIKYLELSSPIDCQTAATDTIPLGLKIEEFLNKMFGENGYMFIGIGRSPSLIAKVVEHRGIPTVQIPMSGFKNCYDFTELDHTLGTPSNFIRYLDELGLSRKKLEGNDKKLVFYDYTDTGKTLELAQGLMEKIVRLPKEMMTFRSLNDDYNSILARGPIQENLPPHREFTQQILDNYIKHYFYNSNAETFAQIPYLYYDRLDRIYDHMSRFSPKEKHKFYNFEVINQLKQLGLLPPQ